MFQPRAIRSAARRMYAARSAGRLFPRLAHPVRASRQHGDFRPFLPNRPTGNRSAGSGPDTHLPHCGWRFQSGETRVESLNYEYEVNHTFAKNVPALFRQLIQPEMTATAHFCRFRRSRDTPRHAVFGGGGRGLLNSRRAPSNLRPRPLFARGPHRYTESLSLNRTEMPGRTVPVVGSLCGPCHESPRQRQEDLREL